MSKTNNPQTTAPKKKLSPGKKFLIFFGVFNLVVASLGAVYFLTPGLKEIVNEKIFEVIYTNIIRGHLTKLETPTILHYDELKGVLYYTPVEGADSHWVHIRNITTGENPGYGYDEYSSGQINRWRFIPETYAHRTGDILEFKLYARGDDKKTVDSDYTTFTYTVQDRDNIIYTNIGDEFYEQAKNMFWLISDKRYLNDFKIHTLEQEESICKINGSGRESRSLKPLNFTYNVDLNAIEEDSWTPPLPDTNLTDLRTFRSFVSLMSNNHDKFSGNFEYTTGHTSIHQALLSNGLYADLEAQGYTVKELQFSNAEVNSYEQNKVEITYKATYRAVHETLVPLTFRQTHIVKTGFAVGFTASQYITAYLEGAEGSIVSSEREIVNHSLMKHLYEMEQNEGYDSFLEPNKFGSYPQIKVKSSSLIATLNGKVGDLPTPENNGMWTSYNYYISGSNTADYMWYQDVKVGEDKYRGVYFTSYRPSRAGQVSSVENSYQYENGYYINTPYWFKFSPIVWDKALGKKLMTRKVIDSQEYYHSNDERTIDGKVVYSGDYEESNIRKWLNNDFFNTAFTPEEQAMIKTSKVDISEYSNGELAKGEVYREVNDKIFLLSSREVDVYYDHRLDRERYATDYAKAMGVGSQTSLPFYGKAAWWLRSPSGRYVNWAKYNSSSGSISETYTEATFGGILPLLEIN